jgi:glycosyltransferase involved in cell wall biosynthesis
LGRGVGLRPRGPQARREMKNNKSTISAIIIAKDEEERIGDCLKSIIWADEIIVVDNSSTDKTAEIAKRKGAKVINLKAGNFSELRNKGAKEARGKWLLYIDADERVTPQLRREIVSKVKSQRSKVNTTAYAIPRRNFILGKELKHGGWWPDYAKRLFKRDKLIKWTGELHEEPQFEGELGHLKNPFIHLKHDNLGEMVEKTNEWSEIEAKLMYKANHPPMNILRFTTAMFREFWLRIIKHKAFMDGSTGIIYALYQVFSRFVSYAKLWELQLTNHKSQIINH